MKRILVLLLGFLLLLAGAANPVLAQDEQWEWLSAYYGIPPGDVLVVNFSPNGMVFVATKVGGAKLVSGQWVDGKLQNQVWVKFLDNIPIYSLIFSPSGEVICASDSLYVSIDNGDTWETVKDAPAFQDIKALTYVGDVLWLGDENAVYSYSPSQGWQVELDQPGQKSFAQSPSGIYIGVYEQGFYYRQFGQTSWTHYDLTNYFGIGTSNRVTALLWFQNKLWLN